MSIPSKNNQNQSWDLLSLYMMVVFENCGYNITVEKEKTLLKNKYSIAKILYSWGIQRFHFKSFSSKLQMFSRGLFNKTISSVIIFIQLTGDRGKYQIYSFDNLAKPLLQKIFGYFLWKTLEVIEFLMNSFFCSQSLNWRLKGMLAWWFGYSVIIFLTYHSHTNKLYDELSWNRNCQTGKN